jgi:hypothetical protein
LGYLPLAIDQAGAYIHKLRISARKYLCRLNENVKILSQKPPGKMWPYHETVLDTWEISFNEIEKENPGAFEIFQVCAFLAGEDMSEKILRYGLEFARMGKHRLISKLALLIRSRFSSPSHRRCDGNFVCLFSGEAERG